MMMLFYVSSDEDEDYKVFLAGQANTMSNDQGDQFSSLD